MILKEKSTDEMFNELKAAEDFESFAAGNNEIFIKGSIGEYLHSLLEEKGITLKDAVKNSGLERTHAYHIFSGKKIPSRDKLLAIAFGISLSFDETQVLMKKTCNRPLYPKNERDAAIIYALMNGYGIDKANDLLYSKGFETL